MKVYPAHELQTMSETDLRAYVTELQDEYLDMSDCMAMLTSEFQQVFGRNVAPMFWADQAASLIRTRPESFDQLLLEIREFHVQTFPHSSATSCAIHLRREVEELLADPTDPEEIADCLLLTAAVAIEAGVDLKDAVRRKLEKNRMRTWGVPDAEGVVEHVDG